MKNKRSYGIIIPVVGFSDEEVQDTNSLPNETWRTFNSNGLDYQISSYGRIKSPPREINDYPQKGIERKRCYKEKIMKGVIDKHGYIGITLNHKRFAIHRLVCECFIGQSDLEVNHKNGNKKDNRIINLEWCTRSENQKHAWKMGLHKLVYNGNKCQLKATLAASLANRKVSINQELEIVNLRNLGNCKYKEIAKLYGIDSSSVGRICRKYKKRP